MLSALVIFTSCEMILFAPRQDAQNESAPTAETQSEAKLPSPLFRSVLATGDLSERDAELVRQLGEAASDARRLLLDRVETMPPSERPPIQEAARLEALAIAHAERCVLHAVLTPRQAHRWAALAANPAPAPRPLPTGPSSTDEIPLPETYSDCRELLLSRERDYLLDGFYVSDLFTAMLESDGRGIPGLTREQLALLRRLDRLMRRVDGAFLARGIDHSVPTLEVAQGPPSATMLEKGSDRSARLRAEIAGRADAIALEVILSPEQAEGARRLAWHRLGVYALSDPELARRLGLSRLQRDQIAAFLRGRPPVDAETFDRTQSPGLEALEEFIRQKITAEDVDRIRTDCAHCYGEEMARHDERCWSILRTDQRRKAEDLLADGRRHAEAARAPKPDPND